MDYNAIAKQYGATNSTPPPSTGPKVDYAAIAQKFGGTNVPPAQAPAPTPEPDKGSAVGNFAKSLVSAPATLIARPAQAIAELAGASAEDVNKFTDKYTGGIVAPVPQNGGDVVKDVGRGIETVALGTGAPVAGGAAFGFGGALENQGGNVLSKEGISDVLVSTLAGMGAGKALDLVGKPLLNAAGKVIGTITPKILEDVASKGSEAVSNFMAHHEIVPSGLKPAINAIPKIAQGVDDKLGSLFKGTASKVADVASSQYPDVKAKGQKHFENIEVNRLFEPTNKPDAAYKNAREIARQAEARGVDLKKVAADNKIYGMDNVDGGKFVTEDTINALRDEAMNGGKEFLRPALKAAEPGVERVPIKTVRERMVNKVISAPNASISPDNKEKFVREIMNEYADNSAAAKLHPNGFGLTDLYDSKLETGSGVYKKPKGGVSTISDSLTQQKKRFESQAFDEIFRKTAPKELGLDPYFKAQEGRFLLADYLESLNSKKAPLSLFQRGVKRASQLAGATTGANIGGPFGMFSGYQFGGIAADTFAALPNPVKVAYLNSIGKTQPEIYGIMKNYVTDAEAAASSRLKLPTPQSGRTIYMPPTQGGKPYTPNVPPDQSGAIGGVRQRKSIKDVYGK